LSVKILNLQIKKKKKREKTIIICVKTDEKLGPGGFYKVKEIRGLMVERPSLILSSGTITLHI
jgi:hypothetical protein